MIPTDAISPRIATAMPDDSPSAGTPSLFQPRAVIVWLPTVAATARRSVGGMAVNIRQENCR